MSDLGISSSCLTHLQAYLASVHNSSECQTCYRALRNPGGIISGGTGVDCSKCRCVSRMEQTFGWPRKLNTCIGRIFHSTHGSTSLSLEDFDEHCPLCGEFDGCRDLFLEAYRDILDNANETTCTRPNGAPNVTEAAKADSFVILFLREQMLSSCNVTAKNNLTGSTYTNYFARLSQHEFRDSLGSGAYCERRSLPEGGADDAGTVEDYSIKTRDECDSTGGTCGAPRKDAQGNDIGGYVPTGFNQELCSLHESHGYRWFDGSWNDQAARREVEGRIWQDVSDLTQCEISIVPCDPGLLCQKDKHPVPCPAGYYCPEFGGARALLCPAGSFCPESSANPIKCSSLGICPEGSSMQVQPLFLILCVMLSSIIAACVFLLRRMRMQKILEAQAGPPYTTDGLLTAGVELTQVGSVASVDKSLNRRNGAEEEKKEERDTPSKIREAIQITFTDIELVVPGDCPACKPRCRCCCCSRSGIHPSTRLAGTSGQIQPGELTCIMGASGAGKSTFLNVISGKLKPSKGKILINGKSGSLSDYKGRIGYVPQSDIMHADATVREIVMHSALTRLPSSDQRAGYIMSRVNDTLAQLGLAHVADSVIGDEHNRGISGGEKKRVNIAMEMVTDPVALLLDEPTSGLDAATAEDVMNALQKIAKSGVTVVAIIHQPRVEIYKLIDKLLLLGRGGKTVYLGSASQAPAYFQSLGYVPEPDDNFADFALDVLSGSIVHRDPATAVGPSDKLRGGAASMKDIDALADELSQAWVANQKTDETNDKKAVSAGAGIHPIQGSRASFCTQFCAYLVRGARLRYVRTYGLITDLLAFLLDGLIIAMIFGSEPLLIPARGMQYAQNCPRGARWKCYSPVRNQIGPFGFYMTMALGIVSASVSTKSFCGPEKVIFWREAGGGVSIPAYFLSVLFIDLPVQIMGALFFVAPVAMFTQFRGPMDLYLLWSVCLVFCVFGMGNLIGTVFETDLALSTMLATMAAVLMNLFGGYVPKAGTGGYYAYTRYSARALSYIEMALGYPNDFPTTIEPKCLAEGGDMLYDQDGCFRNWDNCDAEDGGTSSCLISKYDRFVVDEHMGPSLGVDLLMLIVIGVVLRVAAFFALKHVRQDKMR